MSILSHFKRFRPEPKEDKEKSTEKKKLSKRATYVPTHAAKDAARGAAIREAEISRVREEHYQRSYSALEGREIKLTIGRFPGAASHLSNYTYANTTGANTTRCNTRCSNSDDSGYQTPASSVGSAYPRRGSFDAGSFTSRLISVQGKEIDRSTFYSPRQTLSSHQSTFPSACQLPVMS